MFVLILEQHVGHYTPGVSAYMYTYVHAWYQNPLYMPNFGITLKHPSLPTEGVRIFEPPFVTWIAAQIYATCNIYISTLHPDFGQGGM